jgi:hypothetical protein
LSAVVDSVINSLLCRGGSAWRWSCYREEEEELMGSQLETLIKDANNSALVREFNL